MKAYAALFRLKFIEGLSYRAAAWAGIATQFFWGFMMLMVFQAFYRSSGTIPPMEWPQVVSYVWLNQAFLAVIMLWFQDGDLLAGIVDGSCAYELVRPYDLFGFWFVRLTSTRLANVTLRFAPVLAIAFVLPEMYKMSPPASLASFGLFALAMTLSLALVVAISMFIYILTFVTLSPIGARLIVGVGADFLMGSVIPIPLMPNWAQKIVAMFPFRYIADLPFRLYGGHIAGSEAALQIGVQLAWIIGLVLLGRWWFARVIKRVVVQGG